MQQQSVSVVPVCWRRVCVCVFVFFWIVNALFVDFSRNSSLQCAIPCWTLISDVPVCFLTSSFWNVICDLRKVTKTQIQFAVACFLNLTLGEFDSSFIFAVSADATTSSGNHSLDPSFERPSHFPSGFPCTLMMSRHSPCFRVRSVLLPLQSRWTFTWWMACRGPTSWRKHKNKSH